MAAGRHETEVCAPGESDTWSEYAGTPMHLLVTEAVPGDSDVVVGKLRAAGVRVSTCHVPGAQCRVLAPGGRCPLDNYADPVDLVVDARGWEPELTAREYGAVCGIRGRRQLVLVGTGQNEWPAVPPELREHGTSTTVDSLVLACRQGNRVRMR